MSQDNLPIERPRQYHSLKCIEPFFSAIDDGSKTFEVRYDDRGYAVGDILILNRVNPDCPGIMNPADRPIILEVTFVLSGEEWGIKRGYKVLGFKKTVLK